ncbi:hypothetical protein [Pseudoalteromonas sp. H105]|uniref:hypothetical protein n=1 Tax=Pseudoalteromonas sp. H105 TaxID=1348393 RepID=UPI001F2CBF12|nr:hypothetical protein [Pseudoalteromonas sp. H105]
MFLMLSVLQVLSNNPALVSEPLNSATDTDFLVIADMPYTAHDKASLSEKGALTHKIQQTPHSLLMHLGDIKAGSEPCTNELLTSNKELLRRLTSQPFIYTPGDNEWTDCDRKSLEPRFDELERLAFVKRLMYTPEYLKQAGRLANYKTQPTMVENARWQLADVEFMTLHIAGTHNGRRQVLLSDKTLANEAAQRRDDLNLKWLSAANPSAKAYVIGFQADIYSHGTEQPKCSETNVDQCDGFSVYREAFDEFAKTVAKPVLVIHGDTGPFCQQTLSEYLTRLNAPGDYMFNDIAHIKIASNTDSGLLEWQIRSLKSNKPLKNTCN